MKRPIGKIIDYLTLCLVMSLSIVLILFFNGNRTYQVITIISTSLLYITWGVIHHTKEGTFHPKIGLEYALFALLGCVLVLGLL